VARGKYVSPDLMRRVVEEAEAEGNIALVARRYGLSHSTVSRWRQKYLKGELQVEGAPLDSENVRRLLIENRELKRLLGDKELKIQILEDLVKKRHNAQEQSGNSRQVDRQRIPGNNGAAACGSEQVDLLLHPQAP
jgi:transposase-like protein